MGVTYTTSIGFGVIVPQEWLDDFQEKQDDDFDGLYEWFDEAVKEYDTLVFQDAGSYYYDDGAEYALMHKATVRSSYDATFVAAPSNELDLDVENFRSEVASFFRLHFGQWRLTADDIEPKWYAGMTVG